MWLITERGFVSLVAHQSNPKKLRARARRREDLTRTFPGVRVRDLGTAAPDYRWHADVTRKRAAAVMAELVGGIAYTSHAKEAMAGADPVRYRAYLDVWTDLYALQHPPRQPGRYRLWDDLDDWEPPLPADRYPNDGEDVDWEWSPEVDVAHR